MNRNDQEFLVQKIRTQYTEKEHTQLDTLRALDTKVRRPANVFAYVFGSIGTIVMGSGMSLAMSDFGAVLGAAAFPLGIVVGILSMAIVALAHPLYLRTLKKERARIAPKILKLTDELMR